MAINKMTPAEYIKRAMFTNRSLNFDGVNFHTPDGSAIVYNPTFDWLEVPKHTDAADALLDAGLGIAGEAGEVADLVKKWHGQGHPLSRAKIIREAGDVLWYVAELCILGGFTFEDLFEANVHKLMDRYPDGHFDVDQSVNRLAEDNG